jgi:hypothetical protein
VQNSVFGTEAFDMHVDGTVTRIVGRFGAPQNSKALLWVSEDVVERSPTSYFVAQGTAAIGNVISLRRSDDDWIVVMAPALPNENVEVVFEGSAPSGAFSRMVFALDGHTRGFNTQFQVFLYDFELADWSLQGTGVFEKDFDFPTCVITDPARFLSPGTRRVRSKIVATFPSGEARSLWVDRVRCAFSP